MKFQDIPKIKNSHYHVDIPWGGLQDHLDRYLKYYNLELDPDFQRGHVWSENQQIAYVEYILREGMSGREIYFNCPNFMGNSDDVGPMQLVDGKQRITAVLRFLNNEIKAFDYYFNEFEDRLPLMCGFSVHINNLKSKKDVLQWYIDLNSGIAHTEEEIKKVKNMMERI